MRFADIGRPFEARTVPGRGLGGSPGGGGPA
ncbi:hypothetical protein Ae168Ps1_5207c [Pseudonocardia sp. Ae168_Ps1]|nr:hypothetical protein Ae150APs1_5166c [Pseudonocardia sp. Ae150A_Ps1]OLL82801.1 hypothetical protein Ae168Ps1_5207c [Pseudonocardia sp. Ae168_Ps1]OLL83086.1 hypothetical protein Ae263Ps1_0141 [Pseudonocardia sp. Ae263_Ps1]OLL90875.1 hypothetical protein Ae356Ps1_0772c [Pseudonocardia sp. Ae356_Ps1]